MECTLVVILLQESHLPLFLLPRSGCKFHILLEPLLLWHRSSPLNLFLLFILGCLGLLFTQESSEFTGAPCFKFGFDVETVGIVDFGDNIGCFLCSYTKNMVSGKKIKREGEEKTNVLSTSSRRILSPASSLEASLRCSSASSSRFRASSASAAAFSAVMFRAFLQKAVRGIIPYR